MKTVAYLCEFPTLLGGERSLLTFLDHAKECIRPVVVAPPEGALAEALKARGVERIDWPGGGRKKAGLLADPLGDRGVEAVHANSLMTADAALRIGEAMSIPAFSHVRDIMGLSPARWERLAELDGVIAVSRAVADWLVQNGAPKDRVRVVYNAIDADAFKASARPSERTSGIRIGCIGQIAIRKGQDLFLEAAALAAEERPELRFVLAGARYSDKEESRQYEEDLREVSQRPPLSGLVDWLGYCEDVPSLLADLDIVVVPSRQEPLSRVLLESLAMGLPAIATDVGGSSEIIDDVLVPPNDADAMAEAMVRLAGDPGERALLSWAAKKRAEDFVPVRQVQSLLEVYRK